MIIIRSNNFPSCPGEVPGIQQDLCRALWMRGSSPRMREKS
jgi:hypothetical protein